ncbi:unnamed protein product [Mytilus coruscus]|uniref:CCHC-type domain-containing protein n=1 Tax=Mytilus coruscus TaxID=42192 RepID=A0A6J8CQ13_MYTCO|nr:unnamed protein product [Mytilus coruscus]
MLNSDDEVQHDSPASHQSGDHFAARPKEPTVTESEFSPADALSLFSQKLESALVKHKQSIIAEIEEKATFNRPSRPSHTPSPKFKFEGNGRRHEFNSSRHEEERGAYGSVKKLLESQKELLQRNKIIRIADKYGWDVVEEYKDDPLTDNTDDATKLIQAEYRAKIKRREKARKSNIDSPYQKSTPVNELFRGPDLARTEEPPRYKYQPPKQVYTHSEYFEGKKETKCYYCNGEGHFAYNCSRKVKLPTSTRHQSA